MKLDTNTEPRVNVCDLPRFIELCNKQNIAVLGMEGGLLSDEGFTPDLNLIADFSMSDDIGWLEFQKESNHGVFRFLKAVNCSKETVFVMTIVNEDEFNKLCARKKAR